MHKDARKGPLFIARGLEVVKESWYGYDDYATDLHGNRGFMADIIHLKDRAPQSGKMEAERECRHRNVVVYPARRKVYCAYCGQELDPFDVLVDMVKGYIPDHSDSND